MGLAIVTYVCVYVCVWPIPEYLLTVTHRMLDSDSPVQFKQCRSIPYLIVCIRRHNDYSESLYPQFSSRQYHGRRNTLSTFENAHPMVFQISQKVE